VLWVKYFSAASNRVVSIFRGRRCGKQYQFMVWGWFVLRLLVLRFLILNVPFGLRRLFEFLLFVSNIFFSPPMLCCIWHAVLISDATRQGEHMFFSGDSITLLILLYDCGNLYTPLCWVCWKVLDGWSFACSRFGNNLAMVGVGLKAMEGLSSCCIHLPLYILFGLGLYFELRIKPLVALMEPMDYSYWCFGGLLYNTWCWCFFCDLIHGLGAMGGILVFWHLFVVGWDSESLFFRFFITALNCTLKIIVLTTLFAIYAVVFKRVSSINVLL